jgi:hypothetical protein
MNSILESNTPAEELETSKAAEVPAQNNAPEIDNEDAKFVSEFAWLAAASVTIASIATSIGFS